MKKKLLGILALILFAAITVSCDWAAFGIKKLKVSHKGETIEISTNAWDAHKAHGDCIVGVVWK